MKITIEPGKYSGKVEAPASKSFLQRAIAIAALADGTSEIQGYTKCKDVDAAINIITTLGAKVETIDDVITVHGIKQFNENLVLNCGEAGLSARMFSPIAALSNQTVTVKGEGSLLQRSMEMVEQALLQCGLEVESNEGKLPLKISGKIKPGTISIDGSESSQLLTGLLISLSATNAKSTVLVKNPKSIPYITMTLELMNQLGMKVKHSNFKEFYVDGCSNIQSFQYKVEGDWSGAAFHLVAAAIAGDIVVSNLNTKSSQADIQIIDVLKQCGADIEITEHSVRVKKAKLHAFEIDITHCPDLFPILTVLAVSCNGTSKISGIHRLKNKESDRLTCMRSEFYKLGIPTEVKDDTIYISKSKINGGKVESHNDHRIAMSMAILALNAESEIEIDGIEAARKSYPTFFKELNTLITNHQTITEI